MYQIMHQICTKFVLTKRRYFRYSKGSERKGLAERDSMAHARGATTIHARLALLSMQRIQRGERRPWGCCVWIPRVAISRIGRRLAFAHSVESRCGVYWCKAAIKYKR